MRKTFSRAGEAQGSESLGLRVAELARGRGRVLWAGKDEAMAMSAWVMVTVGIVVAAGDGTPGPQGEGDPVCKAVHRAVVQRAKQLGDGDAARREEAEKALARLATAPLTDLAAAVDPSDPEQLARARRVLDGARAAALREEMLLSLPATMRASARKLAAKRAVEFGELFSRDPEQAARAVKAVGALPDPAAEAEGVLLWALRGPIWQLRRAAMMALLERGDPGKATRDTLLARLHAMPAALWKDVSGTVPTEAPPYSGLRRRIQCEEYALAMTCAVRWKDARVLGPLLGALLAGGCEDSLFDGEDCLEHVLRRADRRAVVTLMDLIENPLFRRSAIFPDGTSAQLLTGDVAMLAILKLTGQEPADYGFHTMKAEHRPLQRYSGFASKKHRLAARVKLKQWWQANRNRYAGVEKVAVWTRPAKP